MAKATIVPVSFDKTAMAVLRTIEGADKAYAKATSKVTVLMQQYVDAWFIANGREPSSVKAMGKAIRDSEAVANFVAHGACEKKTFTEYAQSAMRALHWNVPFEASLKNKSELIIPGNKAKTGTTQTSGKVTSTTRTDADKTLSKALAQYRALGLTEFAADLLDVAIDCLDGFKETILDK